MPVEPTDLLQGDSQSLAPARVCGAKSQGPITTNGQRSFVLSSPPMQFTTGRNIPLVVAGLVHDKKVVNLRGHKAVIIGDLGQHCLQFSDRDGWTLGRLWNQDLVPCCEGCGTALSSANSLPAAGQILEPICRRQSFRHLISPSFSTHRVQDGQQVRAASCQSPPSVSCCSHLGSLYGQPYYKPGTLFPPSRYGSGREIACIRLFGA